MRCVSKCFIGGRSLRVYSFLFLGMLVGFFLSTLIQTLNFASMQKTTRLTVHRDIIHMEGDKKTVQFSNLQKDPGGGGNNNVEDYIQFGDVYDYQRPPEAELKRSVEGGADLSAGAGHVQHKQAISPSIHGPVKVDQGAKLKQMEYQGDNWQDHDAIGLNANSKSPNQLSEEVAIRKTLLVAVVTSVRQLMTLTLAIQGTWGPEANMIFFIGKVTTLPHLPQGMNVVQLEGVDDDNDNWELKEIHAVRYLITHHLDSIQWFMIIGDQTYVVTDQLKKKLNSLDAGTAIYMGRPKVPSGDSQNWLCRRNPGIVYSRALLQKLEAYLPMCWPNGQEPGTSLTSCLVEMGVQCTQAKEVSYGVW